MNLKSGGGDINTEIANDESVSSHSNVEAKEQGLATVVDWDGPDDPQNPQNWPTNKRWAIIIFISAITFNQ
jgi:hypothetical protein